MISCEGKDQNGDDQQDGADNGLNALVKLRDGGLAFAAQTALARCFLTLVAHEAAREFFGVIDDTIIWAGEFAGCGHGRKRRVSQKGRWMMMVMMTASFML
jgi:hypothetical protein